ncbi:MAG: protein kinase [Rhodoferax sp.]|nr:protein kinase [Rhodoferax sp.]
MHLQKLGRYELIRVLGKGAMGLVYEGRDPNLDRRVAIKTIKVENLSKDEATEYEVRFRTEARSAARLQHPNIVSVYDANRDHDIAYLVMEFIDGEDLKHHLDQGKRFSLEQTVAIMHDLLSALDYAHKQHIVHRDIKPANLLIEPSGRIKLTDFGVARIQDSGEATRTRGTMVGTLKYMSPEQVQGLTVDARSDLFAAGIVLYQLLTGSRPFNGSGDYAIIQQILTRQPDPPTTFNPGLPIEVDAVVARALAKSRGDRYQDARAFDMALAAAAQHASDASVTPPTDTAISAFSNSTWTETMVAGEELLGIDQAGSKPGSSSDTVTTVTQEAELIYWKEIKDSTDVEDFQNFLSKFPTGTYAELAQRRLKRLANPGTSDAGQSRSEPQPATLPGVVPDGVPAAPSTSMPRASAGSNRTGKVATMRKTRRSAWVGTVAALLVAGGAGLGFWFMQPVPDPTPIPAPQVAQSDPVPPPAIATSDESTLEIIEESIPPATRPVPDAASKPGTASAPASPASRVSPGIPASGAAARTKKTPASAAASAPERPERSGVVSKPGADTQKDTHRPMQEVITEEESGVRDPKSECEGRWFLGFQLCMREQCNKPQYAQTAVCVERRAMEQRNLEAEKQRR